MRTQLEVGDYIAKKENGITHDILKVTRVTPTQACVEFMYWKFDRKIQEKLRPIGHTFIPYVSFHLASEEEIQRKRLEEAKDALRDKFLNNYWALSKDDVDVINNILTAYDRL